MKTTAEIVERKIHLVRSLCEHFGFNGDLINKYRYIEQSDLHKRLGLKTRWITQSTMYG